MKRSLSLAYGVICRVHFCGVFACDGIYKLTSGAGISVQSKANTYRFTRMSKTSDERCGGREHSGGKVRG